LTNFESKRNSNKRQPQSSIEIENKEEEKTQAKGAELAHFFPWPNPTSRAAPLACLPPR
jgi:hypothetical protein